MSSDLLKSYEHSEDLIKKLYDSKLRLSILDSLRDSSMQLSDLRRAVNANAPNTSSKAKDLEALGLIEHKEGVYTLTTLGRVVTKQIGKSLDFYSVCERFKEFWVTQNIDAIPDEFLERIDELKKARVIKITQDNANAPLELLFGMITSAKKKFYGMCPFYHKIWTELPKYLIGSRLDTEVILTDSVLRESAKVYTPDIIAHIDKNLRFYEIKGKSLPAFMITESFFAMALESKGIPNAYLHNIIYSRDVDAVKWASELLEYYKKQAKSVRLADYANS